MVFSCLIVCYNDVHVSNGHFVMVDECVVLQLMLLEDGWRELFVLSAAQFLLPVEAGPLLASSGLTCQSSDRLLPILQDIKLFQDILAKFKAMWLDPTEYACLKAIVLFKSGNDY